MGGPPAYGSDAAAGLESARSGIRQRTAVCVQRYVETVLERDCRRGWPGIARARSIPHSQPFESSGGCRAPSRERTPARPEWRGGQATEAHAVAVTAAG